MQSLLEREDSKPMEKQTKKNMATKRRSEKAGIINFTREMISALLMAFVAIVYVIQAFKIPTGSMEDSLLVGDFLLGLKFIYGSPLLPFTYAKFPGITSPKPGDVVIFKYPGRDKKDYIKRCIAGPGQTIEIHKKTVIVDKDTILLPPNGKYQNEGNLDKRISYFRGLKIPARGDTLYPGPMDTREFLYFKHLLHQENPRDDISVKYQLYLDGEFSNSVQFKIFNNRLISFDDLHKNTVVYFNRSTGKQDYLNFNNIDDWLDLDGIFSLVRSSFQDKEVDILQRIFLNGEPVKKYVVKRDNYFMMGDNRDNSKDSRFWGYVNRNFIKAKAFILYFSLDMAKKDRYGNIVKKRNGTPKKVPIFYLPFRIRWNRIGKLIRGWNGLIK